LRVNRPIEVVVNCWVTAAFNQNADIGLLNDFLGTMPALYDQQRGRKKLAFGCRVKLLERGFMGTY
jgi:hypothetical protein